MYIVIRDDDFDVWEIIKVDDNCSCIVMQTNIRTVEKACEALKIWQQRERDKHERQN